MINNKTPELRQAYEQGVRDGKRELWWLVGFFALIASGLLGELFLGGVE